MINIFLCIFAQNETQNDTINIKSLGNVIIPEGYLLDMNMIMLAPPTLVTPKLSWKDVSHYKDFNELFMLKSNITNYKGAAEYNSVMNSSYSFYSDRLNSMQKTSLRLKNGMQLNMYGEYDSDGNKRNNQASLPWEKNNFNGAFEMKTKNGNFGIKVEVKRGRETGF